MSVRRLGVRGRDVCPVCKQSLEVEYDSSWVLDPTDAHDAHIQCVKEVEGVAKVPQFRGDAHGTRSDWNPRSATTFWGNKVAWRFPDVLPGSADIQTFLTFLGLRPDASGEPVVNRLGAPEWKGDGWFRLEWNHKTRRHELSIATHAGWSQDTIVPFVRNKAPGTILNFISDLFVVDAKGQRHEVEYRLWETDVGELDFPLSFVLVEQVSQGDAANHTGYTPWWERAWHGCKLERGSTPFSNYHGRLLESRDLGVGHRFLGDAPGVHCHNDGTQHKANGYMRWVPLCLDDVFWGAKFEVLVDRNHCATVARKTDQWVQRARGVQLGALWVCGRVAQEMHHECPAARHRRYHRRFCALQRILDR